MSIFNLAQNRPLPVLSSEDVEFCLKENEPYTPPLNHPVVPQVDSPKIFSPIFENFYKNLLPEVPNIETNAEDLLCDQIVPKMSLPKDAEVFQILKTFTPLSLGGEILSQVNKSQKEPDDKPKRKRGRKATMTTEQKKEKSRLCARRFRERRKNHFLSLERQLKKLEKENAILKKKLMNNN